MEFLVFLIIIGVVIAGMWKMFTKAGQPGWACIVPIYNILVLLRIAGKPWWWIFLYLIPIVSLVIAIMVTHTISKRFGFGVGMTLLQIFLPFIALPILGFGSSVYKEDA
jgi:uncharacterized membrane protein YoaK (UPF0700 family)